MTRARIQLKFLTLNPTLFSAFHLDLLLLGVAGGTVKIEDKVVAVVVVLRTFLNIRTELLPLRNL